MGSTKEASRRHYVKHKAELALKHKAYYEAHKEQVKAYAKKWASENKARRREVMRKYQMSLYGLTIADYEKLFVSQQGQCAICSIEGRLDVDHDHKTNEVRGLLCGHCNRGLGHLKDSAAIMRKAVAYLERTPPK